MNRRDFLLKSAIIAAGVVAADQLELLERLAPRRLYFRGADFRKFQHKSYALGFEITQEMIDDDSMYRIDKIETGRMSSRKYMLMPRGYLKSAPLITIGNSLR